MHDGRHFRILFHLLKNDKVTAPELAKEFEVSVRTIYRDIDTMSAAGIPVYMQERRNGGFQKPPFQIFGRLISASEMAPFYNSQ